jgi:quercetin dioxygenase-like cupin family protein
MSRSRHTFLVGQDGHFVAELAAGSWNFKHGHVIGRHSHVEDQLLFASEGVMSIETSDGIWVVPPLRAVWISAQNCMSWAENTARLFLKGKILDIRTSLVLSTLRPARSPPVIGNLGIMTVAKT